MIRLKYICSILLIIIVAFSCEKREKEFPMDINFIVEPLEPKTTNIVKFEISRSNENLKNQDLFYRWDWDGDSIWDTDFSSVIITSKRFRRPGDYKIALQYADGTGKTRIVTKSISITQGFSAPKADFIITPDAGNFRQTFVFDARPTIDYEDSLNTLLFRWDFQGDGYWDTDFDTSRIIDNKYDEVGIFHPRLEVRDPANLIGSAEKELTIHRKDTLIQVNIEWLKREVRVGDTVVFDVSSSFHIANPENDFKTSWLLPNNPLWSEPTIDKQLEYIFRREGENTLSCKIIMDHTSLENTGSIKIFAAEENFPPEPSFDISIPYGNINTQFYFDCWGTRDDNLPTSQVLLRWDWDNDGIWDTSFSMDKEYFHQYNEPGKYEFALQAKDDFQKTKTVYGRVTVSPYENPTSYFRDIRDGELYGTVQIGDQWWMAENLRFEVPDKAATGFPTTICLYEQEKWCESLGKLYHVTAVISDRFDDKEDQVCPEGWRIPTREDLEELVETVGPQNGYSLTQGGSTDFMGSYAGYCDFVEVGFPMITDTIYVFHETLESFYLFSGSIAEDINEARTDTYMVKISREDGSLWQGYLPTRYYMPLRCIKED